MSVIFHVIVGAEVVNTGYTLQSPWEPEIIGKPELIPRDVNLIDAERGPGIYFFFSML